jgi:N-acetylglucosaminyl-diphospho-decaprenol L-rhamnosyltransferase
MAADLDVVIVTYNSIQVIDGLLDSLPAALDGLAADIVIVDNGSADGTAGHAEARGDCRVVRAANTGYAAGINRGVREAMDAEAILVLNPDVRLAPGAIAPLLAALAEPGVGIAVPQIRSPSGGLDLSLRREPTVARSLGLGCTGLPMFSEYVTRAADYCSPRIVDWALGAVMLMSRKCYQAVGGWDESFFLYSEETDLCLRARDHGFLTRYQPESVAVHIGGASGRSDRTHAMQTVNRVRLYRRRHGPATSWCYFWLTIASQASWVLRGHTECRAGIEALLHPSRRPPELACSSHLLPR